MSQIILIPTPWIIFACVGSLVVVYPLALWRSRALHLERSRVTLFHISMSYVFALVPLLCFLVNMLSINWIMAGDKDAAWQLVSLDAPEAAGFFQANMLIMIYALIYAIVAIARDYVRFVEMRS